MTQTQIRQMKRINKNRNIVINIIAQDENKNRIETNNFKTISAFAYTDNNEKIDARITNNANDDIFKFYLYNAESLKDGELFLSITYDIGTGENTQVISTNYEISDYDYIPNLGELNVTAKIDLGFQKIKITSDYTFKNSIDYMLNNYCDFSDPLSANCNNYFYNEESIITLPKLNTTNTTGMSCMFMNCSKLENVPLFDTSKVNFFTYMFAQCMNLKTIPKFDTKNAVSLDSAFSSCHSLEEVPLLDTSSVSSMSCTFQSCSKLETVPDFDTSKVASFNSCFQGCVSLVSIPKIIGTDKAYISNIFADCPKLERVEEINLGSMYAGTYPFGWPWSKPTIVKYMVAKNLGKNNSGTNTYDFTTTLWGQGSDEAKQSLVDSLVTYTYDRAKAGWATSTIKLPSASLALLSDTEKAAITAKGYTLTA
jgi:hypothetical protein